MNTDNMAVSGETIAYGPCAFMDEYRPDKVFSSIDARGRYAWQEQPNIAVWNLAQLASCLVPLMGNDDAAVEEATQIVHSFPEIYQREWLARFAAKLGIADPRPKDRALVEQLLALMAEQRADFTRVFAGLADGRAHDEFAAPEAFDNWADDWQARIRDLPDAGAVMARANPRRIPRNHRIEAVIAAARDGDDAPFHALDAALRAPFQDRPDWDDYALAPQPDEIVRRTFCGT